MVVIFLLPLRAAAGAEAPLVLVTIPPQAFIVERLAGSLVRTVILVPATANHETYEPSLRQLQGVKEARLFLRLGHPQFSSEKSWAEEIAASGNGMRIVAVAEGIPLLEEDIHFWLSPSAMAQVSETTLRALLEVVPEAETELTTRYNAFREELREQDALIRNRLQPYRGRTFLVYHPAWGYFAKEYGLKQHALESHGKEPGTRAFLGIAGAVRKERLRVLFIDPQTPRSIAGSIAEQLQLKLVTVDPMSQDWLQNLAHFAAELDESYRNVR